MIVEIHSERLFARSPVTHTNSHTVGGRRQDHREREGERENERTNFLLTRVME